MGNDARDGVEDLVKDVEANLTTDKNLLFLNEGERNFVAWLLILIQQTREEKAEEKAAPVAKDRKRELLTTEERSLVDRAAVSIISRRTIQALAILSRLRGEIKDLRLAVHMIGCPIPVPEGLKDVLDRVYKAQVDEAKREKEREGKA